MSTTGTTTTADLSLTIRPEVLLVEIANKYQAMRAEIARLSAELAAEREKVQAAMNSACEREGDLIAERSKYHRLVDEFDAMKLGLVTERDELHDELARVKSGRSMPSGREPCDWMSKAGGGAGDQ
jgi:uncharacterized small protein (DUF1192 family)